MIIGENSMKNKYIPECAIPYMGSKRALANKLVTFMLKETPNAKYFFDIFGGGGAMSFEAIQHRQLRYVYYNELNTGLVSLLKDIRDNGIRDEYYAWVSREEFNAAKNGDDWKSGLIKSCWSFGNNQHSYLFGKEVEEDKHLLHEIIVNRCQYSADKFNKKYNIDITSNYTSRFDNYVETIDQRRLRVMRQVKMQLQQNLQHLKQIEQIERLQRLEQIQQISRIQQLNITNLSYASCNIDTPTDETIIYLDPPYINTASYQEGICHKEFYAWVDKLTELGYKIYVSSYESHLPLVLQLKHRCTLRHNQNNLVVENVFCNNGSTGKRNLDGTTITREW